MLDSTKQNPNCNFAEEVVSYIYDEMESSKKVNFESHLVNCSPCIEEVSAFKSVSLSIQEWHEEEFAHLETPKIVIPYETEKPVAPQVQEDELHTSWIGSLREMFAFSPAFFKTATAFGTLALAIGLAWFLVTSSPTDNNSVAEKESNVKEQKDELRDKSINLDKSNQESPEIKTIAKDEQNIEGINKSVPKEKVLVANTVQRNKNKVVKVKQSRTNKVKKKKVYKRKNKGSQSKPKTQDIKQIQEVPRLTDFALEDSEDTDLQLTDFFTEDESGD